MGQGPKADARRQALFQDARRSVRLDDLLVVAGRRHQLAHHAAREVAAAVQLLQFVAELKRHR